MNRLVRRAASVANDPEGTFTSSESGNVFPLDITLTERMVRKCSDVPLPPRAAYDPSNTLRYTSSGLDLIVPFTA
jgi:hypothetical protein